jgi:hypothetical protein
MPQRKSNKRRSSSAKNVQNKQLTALKAIQLQTRSIQRTSYYRPDPQMLNISDLKTHTFRRSYETSVVQPAGLSPAVGALIFRISNLPAYTEFTQLFDQYRILEATVRFVPTFSTSTNLYTVVDYDDATLPTALTDLDQYSSLTVSESGTMVVRTLHPKVAVSVYQGAVPFTGYASGNLWIDSISNSVEYYGLKYYIPATAASTGTALYTISVSLVISCRLPH